MAAFIGWPSWIGTKASNKLNVNEASIAIFNYKNQVEKMKSELTSSNLVQNEINKINKTLMDDELLNQMKQEVLKRIQEQNLNIDILGKSLTQMSGSSITAKVKYWAGLSGILNILLENQDPLGNQEFNQITNVEQKIKMFIKKYIKSTGQNFERAYGYLSNSVVSNLVNENLNEFIQNANQSLTGPKQRYYQKSSVINKSYLNGNIPKNTQTISYTEVGDEIVMTTTYHSAQKADIDMVIKSPDKNELFNLRGSLKAGSNKIYDISLFNELSRWETMAAKYYTLSLRGIEKIFHNAFLTIIAIHGLAGQEENGTLDYNQNANYFIYLDKKDFNNPIKAIAIADMIVDPNNIIVNNFPTVPIKYTMTDMNNALKNPLTVHIANLNNMIPKNLT